MDGEKGADGSLASVAVSVLESKPIDGQIITVTYGTIQVQVCDSHFLIFLVFVLTGTGHDWRHASL